MWTHTSRAHTWTLMHTLCTYVHTGTHAPGTHRHTHPVHTHGHVHTHPRHIPGYTHMHPGHTPGYTHTHVLGTHVDTQDRCGLDAGVVPVLSVSRYTRRPSSSGMVLVRTTVPGMLSSFMIIHPYAALPMSKFTRRLPNKTQQSCQ